jgi:carbon-monoxide dehydrogenase medium subunit
MNEMTNSHILVNNFAYYEPTSLEQAIQILERYEGQARLLSGGTDLFVHMKIERSKPEAVINLNRIPDLDRIQAGELTLTIGARAPILSIERAPHVQEYYQALAEACASFSTTQIQIMGTLGGNLGNGSPASDSAPALIAFNAQIELTGPQGARRLPLEDFFTGPGKTVLGKNEVITSVTLPLPAAHTGSAFLKNSRVAADIAKASAAVVLVRDHEHVHDCRIALGSVAPTPMRARQAEALLEGQVFSKELAEVVAEAAAQEITPIDDVRSTSWYRRDVVRVMVYDALLAAWQRAAHAPYGRWAVAEFNNPFAPAQDTQPMHLEANQRAWIELTVNDRKHALWVAPNDLLLNVLREQLQLTGTKYGCGIGECSACTVHIDGQPALACLVLAIAANGKEVRTIEGLQSPEGELDPIQEAFIDYAAYQCGYCTPGMLMTAKSLLNENPHPSENDVRRYLRGNICRCTGYANIVRAVLSVAEPV